MTDETVEAPKKKKAKLRKFVVRAGYKICVVKDEYANGGDVVELTAKMANHFNRSKALDPYIPPVEDDEDD